MRNLLDQTGGLWAIGYARRNRECFRVDCYAARWAGDNAHQLSFDACCINGMIIVGVPYSESGLTNMRMSAAETPYGATTLAGTDGSRQTERERAEDWRAYQGRHVAEIASKTFR